VSYRSGGAKREPTETCRNDYRRNSGAIKTEGAANFGLIIAELAINSFKRGFPDGQKGRIEVDFSSNGQDWRLQISDNCIGRQIPAAGGVHMVRGTRIVESLVRHMKAEIKVVSNGSSMATLVEHRSEPN
jgi:two-component sensor histidine kinase